MYKCHEIFHCIYTCIIYVLNAQHSYAKNTHSRKLIFAQIFIIKLWDRKFVIDIVIQKPYYEKLIVMRRSDGQYPSIAPKKMMHPYKMCKSPL